MQTQLGQEHLLLLCVHACNILFELCADRQDHCALRVRDSLYSLEALIFLVVAGKAFLVHVGRIDDLLCGQQVALVYDAVDILVLAEALKGAGGLALLEMCLELFQNVYVEQQLLVCLGRLARALQTAFQMLDVRKNELEIDGLDVARRIDRALDVNDVLVVEAADNVYDCVDFADMGQELVAQTLALACAADQTGDVYELYDSRGGFLRVIQIGQRLKTLIRYRYHADVRVDGAERVVRALRACLRDRIEQSGLADVRKTDNAEFHMFFLQIL